MNNGLKASLRLLAALAVLLMAGLLALFVLNLIPREQLADTASQWLSLLAILAVALLALSGLLSRRE